MADDFRTAFNSIPPVTRTLVFTIGGATLCCLGGILSYQRILYAPGLVFPGLEFWRFFTSFLFAGSGLSLIFDMFLFGRSSLALETDAYFGDQAKYSWALLWVVIGIHLCNIVLGHPYLFRSLLVAIVHLWSRYNMTSKVSLWGLISIPAPFYPFALLLVDFLKGGPNAFYGGLIGLIAAHAYWFLTSALPRTTLPSVQRTLRDPPNWWRNGFARPPRVVQQSAGSTVIRGETPDAGGYRWGGGTRLGGKQRA